VFIFSNSNLLYQKNGLVSYNEGGFYGKLALVNILGVKSKNFWFLFKKIQEQKNTK